MARLRGPGPKARKNMRLVSYGVVGDIAGTVIGASTGFNPKLTHKIGAGVGVFAGHKLESRLTKRSARRRDHVPSVDATKGEEYKFRVGTKTNARVAKKDHPYMVGGKV